MSCCIISVFLWQHSVWWWIHIHTIPHKSMYLTWTLFHFLTFTFFFSQRNTFYTSVAPTHIQRAPSLTLSLADSLSLSVSPDWEKLSSSQNPLCLCVLMRTNAQADTHGHIHVHQNIALNTHVTYACRQRQSWGRSHTARLQDNETDIQDGLKALRSELTRSNGLMLKDRFSYRLMCLKHLAWAQ